ncbi:hypothetical protein HG536_0B04810 [Torulaspora globosa]|uniref:R3H domain-containing protein n=1 Tax=Torulaspora globosa TaxID=48254 RepID=A0A7G3ZDN1_9SACH|nr:uncharacterized protein HG536_0B04810 [Torulaspora globosa]QLL31617.1 hypothetical protein HG536_0B04810 [Torulaspora globosa]
MVTALFHKPHDRQFIIDLENSIVSFIESNAESYELRPMNSYYRLLSHQIADYHNLKHTLARAPSNYVIIFKGAGFQRLSGKPLLQELEPVSSTFESLQHSQEAKSSKKYKILKRIEGQDGSTSPSLADSEISSTGPSSDFDGSKADLELQRIERERQYEQKKQEIFDTPHREEVSPDKDEEGSSPQPSQFETSRYRFHNIDSPPPPQPRYNNRRKKANHYNGNKDRRNINDSKFSHKEYRGAPGVPYNMGYMMYPTATMGSGQGHHPLLPMLYPAPFPMDGNNGYVPPFMYQPVTNGMVGPKGPMPASYMAFPPPFHYSQHAPNYQTMPPEVQNRKYSQVSSEEPGSSSTSSSNPDIQSRTGKQKADHNSIRAENGVIDSAIDEAANGIGNLSV